MFDNADTNNPKLKQVVRDMIDAQLKQFAEYHAIKKYSLIGSILTKRYRDDADLDINILFDVPESERREIALETLRKNLKDVNGKLIPVQNTPINYFVIVDQASKRKMIVWQMAYLMYRIISLLEDQRKNNLTKKNIWTTLVRKLWS